MTGRRPRRAVRVTERVVADTDHSSVTIREYRRQDVLSAVEVERRLDDGTLAATVTLYRPAEVAQVAPVVDELAMVLAAGAARAIGAALWVEKLIQAMAAGRAAEMHPLVALRQGGEREQPVRVTPILAFVARA